MFYQWIAACTAKIKSLFVKKKPTEEPTAENLFSTLEKIEDYCKDGNVSAANLEDLIKVANNIPKSLSIELFKDKSIMVSFLSKTSQGLLEAVSKKYYRKETILRSHLISPCPTVVPINAWWSNDESIYYFLLFMKDMTEQQLLLTRDSRAKIQREKEEFLDTYLYRMLVSDYINLLKIVIVELI